MRGAEAQGISPRIGYTKISRTRAVPEWGKWEEEFGYQSKAACSADYRPVEVLKRRSERRPWRVLKVKDNEVFPKESV